MKSILHLVKKRIFPTVSEFDIITFYYALFIVLIYFLIHPDNNLLNALQNIHSHFKANAINNDPIPMYIIFSVPLIIILHMHYVILKELLSDRPIHISPEFNFRNEAYLFLKLKIIQFYYLIISTFSIITLLYTFDNVGGFMHILSVIVSVYVFIVSVMRILFNLYSISRMDPLEKYTQTRTFAADYFSDIQMTRNDKILALILAPIIFIYMQSLYSNFFVLVFLTHIYCLWIILVFKKINISTISSARGFQ